MENRKHFLFNNYEVALVKTDDRLKIEVENIKNGNFYSRIIATSEVSKLTSPFYLKLEQLEGELVSILNGSHPTLAVSIKEEEKNVRLESCFRQPLGGLKYEILMEKQATEWPEMAKGQIRRLTEKQNNLERRLRNSSSKKYFGCLMVLCFAILFYVMKPQMPKQPLNITVKIPSQNINPKGQKEQNQLVLQTLQGGNITSFTSENEGYIICTYGTWFVNYMHNNGNLKFLKLDFMLDGESFGNSKFFFDNTQYLQGKFVSETQTIKFLPGSHNISIGIALVASDNLAPQWTWSLADIHGSCLLYL